MLYAQSVSDDVKGAASDAKDAVKGAAVRCYPAPLWIRGVSRWWLEHRATHNGFIRCEGVAAMLGQPQLADV